MSKKKSKKNGNLRKQKQIRSKLRKEANLKNMKTLSNRGRQELDKQGLYEYLFKESPYKDFWTNYIDCEFYLEDFGQNYLWIHSPFLDAIFSKETEETYVNAAKRRWNLFNQTKDLLYVERAYRQSFLLSYLNGHEHELTSKEINELIIDWWEDTERPNESKETWDDIFGFLTPSLLDMSDLPKGEFKIYRGGNRDGMSWTLDKEKGQWFAKRAKRFSTLHDEYLFHEEIITEDDVLFYTNGREEQEVVLKETSLFSSLKNVA